MSLLEIIVLIGAIALVGFTITFNIIRKLKRKGDCGGCCSKCKGCH